MGRASLTQKNCFRSQKLSLAEWPLHRANQKLVVRVDWLFLASLTKILGLGEGRLENESSAVKTNSQIHFACHGMFGIFPLILHTHCTSLWVFSFSFFFCKQEA